MHKEFLMGNEAIALGALAAGVNLVSGYPGTPSTEVLETIAKRNPGNVYVEWSINEKAGMEVAAGAAYSGARALVTMKQVGLNVASDPLMSLEYIGVKGGMVVLVADDPGPISSQTEQDTRTFGMFSKVPVFDPASVAEAYEMIQEAFDFSEKYGTPVFFRLCGCLYLQRPVVSVRQAEAPLGVFPGFLSFIGVMNIVSYPVSAIVQSITKQQYDSNCPRDQKNYQYFISSQCNRPPRSPE